MPHTATRLHLEQRTAREMFLEFLRSQPMSGPCLDWPWVPHRSGYGHISNDGTGRQIYAHRWVYDQIFGIKNSESVVMHSCDRKRCVRPGHLVEGTQKDNMRDASKKGRTWRGAVGAPPGEKHPAAKISDKEVEHIRALFANGTKQVSIAASFGISRAQVWRIVHGQQRTKTTR